MSVEGPVTVVENAAGESGDIDEVWVGGFMYGHGVFPPGHPARAALDGDPGSFVRLVAKVIVG